MVLKNSIKQQMIISGFKEVSRCIKYLNVYIFILFQDSQKKYFNRTVDNIKANSVNLQSGKL